MDCDIIKTNECQKIKGHEDVPVTDNMTKEEKAPDFGETLILDQIQECPAVFKSQQRGDPDLTLADKRKIAEDLLHKDPVKFLIKFGAYLNEKNLNFFLDKSDRTYEIEYYVNKLKTGLNDEKLKTQKRNRRYEAMKRMEATTSYFSEEEMEKRNPLLYYQMVGQYLSEKEKLHKNQQANKNIIPTFSNFLIYKMERDEINELIKQQQEEEGSLGISSDDEPLCESEKQNNENKRWGNDWEDEQKPNKKKSKSGHKEKNKLRLTSQEKKIFLQEFTSIMKSNFLSGLDDFNYSDIDTNPEYDCLEIRSQDEEEKYFDDETYDEYECTDTGIEDY